MIRLPKPPSINHLYGLSSRGGFARSYITKAGLDWFSASIKALKAAQPYGENYPITENVFLTVHLYTARMQDIDNFLKAPLDLIANTCLSCGCKYTSRTPCACGKRRSLLQDDRQIFKLYVEKHKVAHVADERIELDLVIIG